MSAPSFDAIEIGDTVCDPSHPESRPRIAIDPPTIRVRFSPNTSPFAGQDGRFLTSRQIGDRLARELLSNVSIRLEDTEGAQRRDQGAAQIRRIRRFRNAFTLLMALPPLPNQLEPFLDFTKCPFGLSLQDVYSQGLKLTSKDLNPRRSGLFVGLGASEVSCPGLVQSTDIYERIGPVIRDPTDISPVLLLLRLGG